MGALFSMQSQMRTVVEKVRSASDAIGTSSATELSNSVSNSAEQGAEVMARVTDTMSAIATSSSKIAEIISVIDGIAFETNILALNAAVEAARAGEQGRGFAVVAGEVRALAQKCAQAAREVKSLISESVNRVQSGSSLVDEAGRSVSHIVSQVQKVSGLRPVEKPFKIAQHGR